MLSIGRVVRPLIKELGSASQLKRLEIREGAPGLKDKERKDLAVAMELTPRLVLSTPRQGTQQDWFRDDFGDSMAEKLQALLSTIETELSCLTTMLHLHVRFWVVLSSHVLAQAQ